MQSIAHKLNVIFSYDEVMTTIHTLIVMKHISTPAKLTVLAIALMVVRALIITIDFNSIRPITAI